MGHRECRRVPLDFDWPLKKVWRGYLNPLEVPQCVFCEGMGHSSYYEHYKELWYGNIPFEPADNGSTPLLWDTPEVLTFAERNVSNAPEFYGTDDRAVRREAERLANLWNASWGHHLNQDDVDALVAGNRLWDFTREFVKGEGWRDREPPVTPTAIEVNAWSIRGMGHDSVNAWVAVKARCEREGLPTLCAACNGEGYPPEAQEAHEAMEAWEPTEPPTGEGWQLWETTSEGSPTSPVFASAEALAEWCEDNATWFADMRWPKEQWLRSFLEDTTSVDSLLILTTGDGS